MTENSSGTRSGARVGRGFAIIALAACAFPAAVWGFAEVAGGTVTLETTARVTSDSNIDGTANGESDVFYSVEPMLVFTRRGSRGTIDLSAGTSFNRYADFEDEDSNDWSVQGHIDIPVLQGARTSGSLDFSYFDGKLVDEYLADRVDIRNFSIDFSGSYQTGGRSTLRVGLIGSNSDLTDRPDVRHYAGRLGLGMKIRPKIDAFLDYRHGMARSSGVLNADERIDYATDAFFVGLTGDIGTRLTGTVSVGWQSTNADTDDNAGDDDQFVSEVRLTWTPRQRTSVSVRAGRDTIATNALESIDNLGVGVSVEQEIGQRFSGSLGLGWNSYETRGVEDDNNDTIRGSVGVEYKGNEFFSVGARLTRYVRYADDPDGDITRTTGSIYGTFKF